MREPEFKCRLVDFLLKGLALPDSVVGLEVPFAGARRRADVLIVHPSNLVGIEIKTELDKMESAGPQLADYLLTFDYVYLATVKERITEARRIVPAAVGLITFNDSQFTVSRQARLRKAQSRLYVADLVSQPDAAKALRGLGLKGLGKSDVTTLRRELVNQVDLLTLKELARNSVRSRYSTGFGTFMGERGAATLEDDLKLLQGGALQIS